MVATAAAQATAPGPRALAGWLVADAARLDAGQWWRAATGPLVHATWGHLVRDLALMLIAGVAYEQPLRRGFVALLASALVLPTLAVIVVDGAPAYYGLSGVSHALLAAALAYELGARRGRGRAYVAALAALGAIKVGYELITGAPAFPMALGHGIRQAPLAHAVGAAIGVGFGVAAALRRSRRSSACT
ncbi:MAG: rhombosortase [Kofleriaceae bacterium]|nr:rhombosortase [Kofleriaceae bacterium]